GGSYSFDFLTNTPPKFFTPAHQRPFSSWCLQDTKTADTVLWLPKKPRRGGICITVGVSPRNLQPREITLWINGERCFAPTWNLLNKDRNFQRYSILNPPVGGHGT